MKTRIHAVADKIGGHSFSGLGGQPHELVVDATGYQTSTLKHRFQFRSDTITIRLESVTN